VALPSIQIRKQNDICKSHGFFKVCFFSLLAGQQSLSEAVVCVGGTISPKAPGGESKEAGCATSGFP